MNWRIANGCEVLNDRHAVDPGRKEGAADAIANRELGQVRTESDDVAGAIRHRNAPHCWPTRRCSEIWWPAKEDSKRSNAETLGPGRLCATKSRALILAQKGVDLRGEESVTVGDEKAPLASLDPAPLAMRPLRGFGGDGGIRHNRRRVPQNVAQQNANQDRLAESPHSRRAGASFQKHEGRGRRARCRDGVSGHLIMSRCASAQSRRLSVDLARLRPGVERHCRRAQTRVRP